MEHERFTSIQLFADNTFMDKYVTTPADPPATRESIDFVREITTSR